MIFEIAPASLWPHDPDRAICGKTKEGKIVYYDGTGWREQESFLKFTERGLPDALEFSLEEVGFVIERLVLHGMATKDPYLAYFTDYGHGVKLWREKSIVFHCLSGDIWEYLPQEIMLVRMNGSYWAQPNTSIGLSPFHKIDALTYELLNRVLDDLGEE